MTKTTWPRVQGLLIVVVAALSGAAAPAVQQTPDPASPATPGVSMTPGQINRIQRALRQPSDLRLNERQLRFYLEIMVRQPTFAEYARGYDFINGPTRRGNPMSHQEFLNMVTPEETYSSGGITALNQLQFAFTGLVGKSLIRKALEELEEARTAGEVREIRERINRELDALTGGRGR